MPDTNPVHLGELEELLSDLTFPTDREQIIAFAHDRKVPDSSTRLLEMLPEVIYHSVDDIIEELEGTDPQSSNTTDTGSGSEALHDGYEDDTSTGGDDEQEIDTTYDTDEPEETHGGSAP